MVVVVMMAAHDGIVFLQLFVFLRNAMGQSGNLSLLDCLQGSKGSPVRGVCHVVCCGHLYIDFGQGQGPSERPSGEKQNLLGGNTNW